MCSRIGCANLKLSLHEYCIVHYRPNADEYTECYRCNLCVSTRRCLEETNNIFTLIGYESNETVEIWSCKICNDVLRYHAMNSCISRDITHEISRIAHLKERHNLHYERIDPSTARMDML